jgi:hypothetical protein
MPFTCESGVVKRNVAADRAAILTAAATLATAVAVIAEPVAPAYLEICFLVLDFACAPAAFTGIIVGLVGLGGEPRRNAGIAVVVGAFCLSIAMPLFGSAVLRVATVCGF